ncbi:MAG: hypothetical protein WAT66_00075 [Actinomycetota bacterium]
MNKKAKWFPILVAVVATALFVLPGLAFGGGGGGNNGTPSPPPSNPPCDADGHGGSPPPYGGPNKNSGSCDNGGSTGNTGGPTNPPCDADDHANRLPKGLQDKCPSTTGSSSSSSTSTASSSSSSTSTASSSSTTGDVCETDGVLGTKGLGLLSPDDRTIGQIVWDEIGIVVQDPAIPPGGPLSAPLYDGLLQLPLNGFESPIAAEVGCLLNNLSL